MGDPPLRVLLITSNPQYVETLGLRLSSSNSACSLSHAPSLQHALESLNKDSFDVILLDLTLPNSQGLESFNAIYARAPQIPVIILSDLAEDAPALQLIREGAQDVLSPTRTNLPELIRAIQFAIARHQVTEKIRQLTLLDDLTGLLNRRGFYALGKQHIQIARRAERHLLLFYCDLDDLKDINDRFGHNEGDRALQAIAAILKDTFRSSDLIARIGGDEFTILAVDAPSESAESILNRLGNNLHLANLRNPLYKLSLSTGYARFDPQTHPDLEQMLVEADRALYRFKRSKTNGL